MNFTNTKKIRLVKDIMKSRQNKTKIAKKMGISRASLYYKPRRDIIDLDIKGRIEEVLSKHKSYDHKRIALELKLNKKRILRVMKKYNIKPYRRITKKPVKKDDIGKAPSQFPNLIKNICPIKPNIIWVTDFTYIKFHDCFIYLSTIMDIYTREIIGFNIYSYHNKELVIGALHHALKRTGKIPVYIHSDQGNEYNSEAFISLAKLYGITISMSNKHSPWENAYQESYYAQFKIDLGFVCQYDTIEELIEGIYQTIYYYNNERIHTRLKMSPIQFKQKFKDSSHITV